MNNFVKGLYVFIFISYSFGLAIAKPDLAKISSFGEINICENGILTILSQIEDKKGDWGLVEKNTLILLNTKERQELAYLWTSLLDYFAQLEYIKQLNKNFLDHSSHEISQKEFTYYYLAFLTQYRYTLVLIDILERNETIHTILNESNPELGLKEESYTQLKSHFLNITIASEFFALNAIYEQLLKNNLDEEFTKKIEFDTKLIFKFGITRGVAMSISNAFQVIRDRTFNLWFPMQKEVAEWLGDTKVWRRQNILLTDDQIKTITSKMIPGDIMLQRREWYMTNVGLPGYWTHSALFIGTATDRDAMMKSDSSVMDWVKNMGVQSERFDDLLIRDYPSHYSQSVISNESPDSIRVIESISEGVIFTSMEESAHCDGIVVLRPSLSNLDKAKAIYRSFKYLGLPYDYNFDFNTDSSLVCTELIFKAYEPLSDNGGLKINTIEIGDRIVAPANLFAHQFSEEWDTPNQQMEFILFYDGFEKQKKSMPSTVEAFLTSWKRPDWYFVVQKN
ncbi:MAG: hypothetical protein HQ509_05455 [Candidatus Marinimicrobia bacterium]|nr:hypothetical protein [Candidatus Neomarinimicrobiota bacterium]